MASKEQSLMKKHITIIAGHDTNEKREHQTLDWLRKHNVTIEEWNDLQVLSMANGEIGRGQYQDSYALQFINAEGDPEESWLSISLSPDPYETRIRVEYEGSYSCSCKGLGCATCHQ